MTSIEITIDNENYATGGSERLIIASRGTLAASLRSCILRVGDHFAHDAAVQRLVDAVSAIPKEDV